MAATDKKGKMRPFVEGMATEATLQACLAVLIQIRDGSAPTGGIGSMAVGSTFIIA